MRRLLPLLLVLGLALPAEAHTLAVGLKGGNGLGPGTSLVYQPLPHWAIDLQAAPSLIGVDLAPSLQYHFAPGGGPFVALGYHRTALSVFGRGYPQNGLFLNGGWQWKPHPQLGLLAGAGYQYTFGASRDILGQTVDTPGLGGINLEFGVRYFFWPGGE